MIKRVGEYDSQYHGWRRVTREDAMRLDAAGFQVIEVPSAPRVRKKCGQDEQVVAAALDYFASPDAFKPQIEGG